MINYDHLITKRWHHYKFVLTGTDVMVEVKAEDRKAAVKIMQDNYPDTKFQEVK